MKIFTSYFGKVPDMPIMRLKPISICLDTPSNFFGAEYRCLSPLPKTFRQYKKTKDENAFIREYMTTVLMTKSVDSVYADLMTLSEGLDVALISHEMSNKFSFRQIFTAWMISGGYYVKEWSASDTRS